MTIHFGAPIWLWGLALVPLVWLARWYGRSGIDRNRRALHAVVRSLVLISLVGALAEPVVSRVATRTAVVYLVDVSHSGSARALVGVADAIDQLNRGVVADDTRIAVFAGRTVSVSATAELRTMASTPTSLTLAAAEPGATNLEQALAAARAEIPADANGRIVLFSDGRETEGNSAGIVERLAAEHVPVFVQPLPVRDLGDTWVSAVRVLRTAVAAAPTPIEVRLGSQITRPVTVEVREGTTVLGRQSASASDGESVVTVEVTFARPGAHLVAATVSTEGDVVAENNELLAEIVVEPRPRVLYVHTAAGQANTAPAAMVQAGLEVTVLGPQALPSTAAGFDRWDVVALSNVARPLIADAAMVALSEWVEEHGGGLLFIGGSAVIGEGATPAQPGYRRTELERVLPVTFDREDEPEVALVIVLDRSWSMNGAPMDLSKAAAEAAANTLAPTQMVGVLTFNNETNWDVPLSRVQESRPSLHAAIERIAASGPTAIFPAVEQAYNALAAARARAKHVILLSDGQTPPADFEGLVKEMNRAGITVSSVAFGPDADGTLLKNIATWGGGRYYAVQDAKTIPEIFVKEAQNASTPGFEEGKGPSLQPRQARWLAEVSAKVPALGGRNVVTRKAQALDLMSTSRGEPILSMWPVGLGRTAMFAADVDGYWTREWVEWRGFGAFLATVTRSLAPRHLSGRALSVTVGDRQGSERLLTVTLDARDVEGRRENGLAPVVAARAAGGAATVPLRQVGAGRYEARVPADTTAPLWFSLVGASDVVGASRILAEDPHAEYRFSVPDVERLNTLARLTGGSIEPTAEAIRGATSGSRSARAPLAPALLIVALLGWLADIGVRRLPHRATADA